VEQIQLLSKDVGVLKSQVRDESREQAQAWEVDPPYRASWISHPYIFPHFCSI
jgi:hypothetical protein